MSEHKGYYLFKQAIEALKPKNIEVLVVDLSQTEGYVHKTYWEGVPVTFIGRVSKDNIVGLYQKIDVLFSPSIWPESFGLVTREAAACGCWVVASDLGGIGEDVVEGNGHLVSAGSLMALQLCIEKINENNNKYKKMAMQYKSVCYVEEQVSMLVDCFINKD